MKLVTIYLIRYKKSSSECSDITCGVTKRAAFWPILFHPYIKQLESNIIVCAGDTVLLSPEGRNTQSVRNWNRF